MPYDLNQFVADCRSALKNDPGPRGREKVRLLLEQLLREREFIEAYCASSAPGGLQVLYEDPDLGFQILAHLNEKGRVSPPHDHGDSWAIYGQAVSFTDMTEWERVDDGTDPAKAQLKPQRTYRLDPGHAGIFQNGAIHSIDYPDKSRFVRVTGANLDKIARVMFDLKTGNVTQMTPQRAT